MPCRRFCLPLEVTLNCPAGTKSPENSSGTETSSDSLFSAEKCSCSCASSLRRLSSHSAEHSADFNVRKLRHESNVVPGHILNVVSRIPVNIALTLRTWGIEHLLQYAEKRAAAVRLIEKRNRQEMERKEIVFDFSQSFERARRGETCRIRPSTRHSRPRTPNNSTSGQRRSDRR